MVALALVAVTLVACSSDTVPSSPTTPNPASATPTPTPPTPPPIANGWIWVMAVVTGGACIEGATFEVVSGQGPIGAVITQETPCSVWDFGGVTLRDLMLNVPVTLRASAAGYNSVEKTILPKTAGTVDGFVLDEVR